MGKQLEFSYQWEKLKDVPFVNEVEQFNATFGKPNNYEPTIPEEEGMASSYTTLYLKNWKNIKTGLRKTETSWKFWMLCVILLMFPLGTAPCYMVLRDKIWPAYQEVQGS